MKDLTHVLVVDDEKDVCVVLSRALISMGFSVSSACRPADAMKLAGRRQFDLALLDINMPQMDGLSLARELKKVSEDIGIIFITGYGNFQHALDAIKLGVADFIEKPFRFQELSVSVNRVAERIRLVKQIRKKNRQLRESNERYRILVENTADGVALFSGGKIIFQNKALAELLGIDSMTLHRHALVDLIHPDDRGRALKNASRLLRGEVIGPQRYRFKKKDGTYCWMSVNSATATYNGEPTIISTFRDITAIVETESIRRDMEKMLRHDMRSHLIGIVGLACRLLEKTPLDEKQREYCCQIRQCGLQMEKMVETYLDVTRMEHGSFKPRNDRFNFMDIVARSRGLLRELADKKNVNIVIIFNKSMYSLEDYLPFVGDKVCLQNALNNLVKNAIEASPENRTVKIKVKDRGDHLCVSVHNWGVIPKEIRNRLFEKYATAGKKNGTGLGAYMAYLVVTSHGGKLSFRSSDSEGTTVVMKLPVKTAACPKDKKHVDKN